MTLVTGRVEVAAFRLAARTGWATALQRSSTALATRLAAPRGRRDWLLSRVLRTNADDRLPLASLGRVESRDGILEVATLPMFVRRRPSRTRWTISLSWARSASTPKSIAPPAAGRAAAGP